MFSFIPSFVRTTLAGLPPVKRIISTLLEDMGMPDSVMMFMNYPTRYDNRDTERALKGSGITCPDLRDYAPVIWDYWERNLDPDLFVDHSWRAMSGGKVVLITAPLPVSARPPPAPGTGRCPCPAGGTQRRQT